MAQEEGVQARQIRLAAEWVERARSGSEEDRGEFAAWLSEDPEHVRQVLELQCLEVETRRAMAGNLDRIRRIQHQKRIINFPASAHRGGSTHTDNSPPEHATDFRLLAMVAGMVLYVFAILMATAHLMPGYETSAGQTMSVMLPDGSQARLNASTRIQLRFQEQFRDVDLERGEALFDVSPDATRPFRVHNRSIVAQALGTRFSVQQLATASTVTVASGHVAVFTKAHDDADAEHIALAAGQRVSVPSAPGGVPEVQNLSAPQMRAALAWTEPTLVMTAMALREAVEEFNRSNQIQMVIDDPSIADFRLGGQFHLHEPEAFIENLSRHGMVAQKRVSGDTVEWHLAAAPRAQLH